MSDHPTDVRRRRDAALRLAVATCGSPIKIGKSNPTAHSGALRIDDADEATRKEKSKRMAHSGAPPHAEADPSGPISKSNPMAQSGARAESDAEAAGQTAKSNPRAHCGARAEGEADSSSQHDKTNPTAHSGAPPVLSHRQLAAVRLLARGHGTMRVAERLGVNRHTIARWKRDPRFAAALETMVASLRESALRLRAGSRNHAYFSYLAMLRGTTV